jgi:hypothetical protein
MKNKTFVLKIASFLIYEKRKVCIKNCFTVAKNLKQTSELNC